MISIDARTGGVVWGDNVLDHRLTCEAFVEKYPQALIVEERYDAASLTLWTRFRLPALKFDDETWQFEIEFADLYHISRIFVNNEFLNEYEDDPDAAWWQRQLRWLASARAVLRSQFGLPNEVQPPSLFDEHEILTNEQLRLLDSWRYSFRWGEAGLSYESMEMSSGIWIVYGRSHQIQRWDEFITEVEHKIKIDEIYGGKHVNALRITEELIGIVRPHIDYVLHPPRAFDAGLYFQLPKQKDGVHLSTNDKSGARYKIQRSYSDFVTAEDDATMLKLLMQMLDNKAD